MAPRSGIALRKDANSSPDPIRRAICYLRQVVPAGNQPPLRQVTSRHNALPGSLPSSRIYRTAQMLRPFRSPGFFLPAALLAIALAATAFASSALSATAVRPSQTQDLPPPLEDAISSAIAALPRARDINADQRKKAEDLLRDAQSDDQAASDALVRRQEYLDTALKAAPVDSAAPISGSEAGQSFADWRAKLPSEEDPGQLSNLLESERNQLGAAQVSLRSLEDALQKQTERPDTLREELAGARAEQLSSAQSTSDTPRTLAAAARLRAQAAERLQLCRIAALETEQRTYEARVRALFAQRTAVRRSIEMHNQRVQWLENRILDRYSSKLSDLVTQLGADRDKLEAAQAAPVLRDAAADNLALGQELAAA